MSAYELENFSNYTNPDIEPRLETAYQGLLDQRNDTMAPVFDTSDILSEDDILINKTLQTESLFKRLTTEFKQKQLELDIYNEQLNKFLEIPGKIYSDINILRNIYITHDMETVDSLNIIDDTIRNFFNEKKSHIADIIRNKLMELENDIGSLTKKLNTLRSLIVTGVNEIVKAEDIQKKMCPVCFDSEVNMALVPCGHTYCKGCAEADKSRYAKCPQCRAQINARIKIFFSI